MANSQQISLNLVAQLDQGNIQSQASQMASTMARAIEDAFEGLGQRIAATIVSGVRSGIQGAIELTGQGRPGTYSPGTLLDAGGRPINGSPIGAPSMVPQAQFSSSSGGAFSFQGAPQYPMPGNFPMGGTSGGFMLPQTQSLRDMNPVLQEARAILAGRQSGVSPEINDIQKDRLREAQSQIRENLESLVMKAGELSQKLQGVSETNANLTQAERDLLSQSRHVGTAAEAQQTALKTVTDAIGEKLPVSIGQRISGIMSAAGIGLGLAGELPGISRRAGAAGAELGNLSGRSLMRGDLEGAITQQRLGGQEALHSKAAKEEGLIIAGEIIAGLGLVLAPLTGGLTGVPALLAGTAGVGALASGIKGGVGFESNVLGNVQGRTEAERQRQAEILQMGQMTRNFAIQSFQSGQEMGGRELSEFFFSAARDPKLSPGSAVKGQGGDQVSLLEFGRQIGMMPEQVQASMRQMGGIGRIFNGQTQLQGMQGSAADMMNLQAFGISGAPQMAGMAARGAPQSREGIREGFEAVKELVSEMVSIGMDKSSINRSMLVVMQQAAQGLGSLGPARLEAERAASAAAATFGVQQGGQVTEAQMEFAQRAMRGFMQAPTAGSGPMGAAGFAATRATQDMLRNAGIKTGLSEELIIQQFGGGSISEEAIERLALTKGGGPISPARAREMSRQSQTNVLQAEQRMFGLFGQGSGLAAANAAGAHTDLEAFQAESLLRSGIQSPSFIGPRVNIPMQGVGGFPGGGETQALAGINVAQITGGVQTLGSNLELINRSLNELLARIQIVSGDFGSHRGDPKAVSQNFASFLSSMPRLPSPTSSPVSLPSGVTGTTMGR